MLDATRCPNCGAERSREAPQGLCPRCLLHAGIEGETVTAADAGAPPQGTAAWKAQRALGETLAKPSNVMVGAFGEVQVMDWGLAKVLPRGGVRDDATAGKIDEQEKVIATARRGSEGERSQAGSARLG